MHRAKAVGLCAAAILLLAGPAAPAAAADGQGQGGYLIHCDRPSKKGDRTRLEFSYATVRTTTTRWEGYDPQAQTEDKGCHLVATEEVLAADAKGRMTSGLLVVETFTKARGGEAILPPGTRVGAALEGGRTRFTVDGRPVDEELRLYLEQMVSLSPADDALDPDRMWGTAVPRRVGETWSLDPKLMVLGMRSMGAKAKEADVTGRCTLVSVGPVDGEPCFDLRSHVEVGSLTPPGYDHPPAGMEFKDASAEADREVFVPVDPAKDSLGYVYSTTYHITTAGQRDDHRFTMEQAIDQRCYCRRVPLATTGPAPVAATTSATRPAP